MKKEFKNTLDKVIKTFSIDLRAPIRQPHLIPLSRWNELLTLFKALGFKKGVEIGVYKGQYTKALLNAGFEVTGIDPWTKYPTYNDYDTERLLEAKKQAFSLLPNSKLTLIEDYSSDAANKFEDESLDFVFIDGNHALEYVIQDIALWSKKVKKGGIVAGHDYFRRNHKDIKFHGKDAVNVWVYCYKITHLFVGTKDQCPTWFYVKE